MMDIKKFKMRLDIYDLGKPTKFSQLNILFEYHYIKICDYKTNATCIFCL